MTVVDEVPKGYDMSQLVCLLSLYLIMYQIWCTRSIMDVTPILPVGLLPIINRKSLPVTNGTYLLWRAYVDLAQLGGTDIAYGTSGTSQKDIVIETGEHWLPGYSLDV